MTPGDLTERPKIPHLGALVILDELGWQVQFGSDLLLVDIVVDEPFASLLVVCQKGVNLVVDRLLQLPGRLVFIHELGCPEVNQLQVPVFIEHKIIELDVPVDDSPLVENVQNIDDLIRVLPDLFVGKLWLGDWWT
jgi:hypothetical protein